MEKRIATHRMRADNGTIYDVDEIKEYIDAGSYDGKEWIEGLKRLELADGTPVNYIDDDTFKIVHGGLIIRRVKPENQS